LSRKNSAKNECIVTTDKINQYLIITFEILTK
jgi:hypothetical protein